MEIDKKKKKKKELSYRNPTYITVGNCYFRKLKVKEIGRLEREEKPVALGWEIRCYRTVSIHQLMEMQVALVYRHST